MDFGGARHGASWTASADGVLNGRRWWINQNRIVMKWGATFPSPRAENKLRKIFDDNEPEQLAFHKIWENEWKNFVKNGFSNPSDSRWQAKEKFKEFFKELSKEQRIRWNLRVFFGRTVFAWHFDTDAANKVIPEADSGKIAHFMLNALSDDDQKLLLDLFIGTGWLPLFRRFIGVNVPISADQEPADQSFFQHLCRPRRTKIPNTAWLHEKKWLSWSQSHFREIGDVDRENKQVFSPVYLVTKCQRANTKRWKMEISKSTAAL